MADIVDPLATQFAQIAREWSEVYKTAAVRAKDMEANFFAAGIAEAFANAADTDTIAGTQATKADLALAYSQAEALSTTWDGISDVMNAFITKHKAGPAVPPETPA